MQINDSCILIPPERPLQDSQQSAQAILSPKIMKFWAQAICYLEHLQKVSSNHGLSPLKVNRNLFFYTCTMQYRSASFVEKLRRRCFATQAEAAVTSMGWLRLPCSLTFSCCWKNTINSAVYLLKHTALQTVVL